MINLLPPQNKKIIQAGRFNTIMLQYIVITLIAVAAVMLIAIGAYTVLTVERANAQRIQSESQQEAAKYAQTQKAVDEYRANLAVAKAILSKEVAYSDFILKIAGSIPSGVVMDQLTLDATQLGQATSLDFKAKSEKKILELKNALQAREELYDDVKIESINLNDDTASGRYPVTATLNLVIKKEGLEQ